MSKPFTTSDVKRIMSKHYEIKDKLSKAEMQTIQYKVSIIKAADELVAEELINVLRDIPIDEINREKKGFRIKALKDYGYNNIADIAASSVYMIASVRGIGDGTAYSIKREIDNIVSRARQGIKIKLSSDNRSIKATKLVSAISRFEESKPYTSMCKNIIYGTNKQIDCALMDVSPAKNSVIWFFTSKQRKQKAIDSYYFLDDLLNNEYSEDVNKALKMLDYISRSKASDDWIKFTENSINFFNILEDVCPGVLGTDDTVYGLPEELAREIQEECFFPDGLLCKLRRYQEWGVKYTLHQSRVLLGDEMGLGKTIQAIAVMVSLRNTGATHFMVICPASVITNWCREIRKMSLLSVIKVHGSGRSESLNSWIKSGGVAVTTYETIVHFKLSEAFKFSMLVVDEAHYIKNPEARRTLNVKQISKHTERLLFMTGTALENRVDEMIELIYILQPNVAKEVESMAFMASAPRFREKVAPVYYRRKRDEVLTELPDLIESKEWCTLHSEEKYMYEQAVLGKRYADARRVSWNVDNLYNSSKAKRLLEIIEEAKTEDRKIIVFSFFLDTIRKIKELLGDTCLTPINGSVSPQKRQEIIDTFDKAKPGTVLLAQIQSGGTGLNIQSASVVILCEPQFKPSIENQAISRAYRMGQSRNVLVYRLLCEDTVDEKISELLENKQAIFDAFADTSVAATESMELDDKKFGDIINEEIKRIKAEKNI